MEEAKRSGVRRESESCGVHASPPHHVMNKDEPHTHLHTHTFIIQVTKGVVPAVEPKLADRVLRNTQTWS